MGKEMKLLYLLDTEVLETLDVDSYELAMVVYLMTRQATKLNNKESFVMEARDLYEYLSDKDGKPNNTIITKSIEALKSLESKGWISIRQMEKNFTYTSKIRVNAYPLLHEDGSNYISFDSDVVRAISKVGLNNFSKILLTYLNITSYIDWRDVAYLKNNDVDFNDVYKLATEGDWHISCFARLATLRTKRFNLDKNEVTWVSMSSLSNYIGKLEDLGLITTISVGNPPYVMNHYCLPEHKGIVEKIAIRKYKQLEWCKKQTS